MKAVPLLLLPFLLTPILVLTWAQRHDPLDLWAMLAGVGALLGLTFLPGDRRYGRLAVRGVIWAVA